jgi:HipA-like protein
MGIKKIFNFIWSDSGNRKFMLSSEDDATFVLSYKDMEIGKLSVKGSSWRFEYSEEFKDQTNILPLSNFPDKMKVYESRQLWPFFMSRIPSDAQLQKKKFGVKSSTDIVNLLKMYGKKTITNPFFLEPA